MKNHLDSPIKPTQSTQNTFTKFQQSVRRDLKTKDESELLKKTENHGAFKLGGPQQQFMTPQVQKPKVTVNPQQLQQTKPGKNTKDLISFLSELLQNKKSAIAKQKSTSVVSPKDNLPSLIDNTSISKQISHDIPKPK